MVRHSGKWISYLRVSTVKQGESGLGLEAQRVAVLAYLDGGKWTLTKEFIEVESGKRDDNRPQLKAAMELCHLTGATLVIAKLDRLSRNVAFLATMMESGVPFVCCDNPHATRFTIHILAAVAEHEREMISRRTKEALAAVKAKGTRLGGARPRHKVPDSKRGIKALCAKADAFADKVKPMIVEMRATGLNLYQIAAKLTEKEIKRRRGGTTWTATAVRRVILRNKAKTEVTAL